MEKKKEVILEKRSSSFNIVISPLLEYKIRLLCKEFPSTEWSGVLYYDIEGSFEEQNLVIIGRDFLHMDIGDSSTTVFEITPDVINYAMEQDLLDCYQGLIHSHHNMATFFSGTDTGTLKSEGNDINHFVSLIVNNKGEYSAAITRNVTILTSMELSYTYKTFEDEEVNSVKNVTDLKTIIEYFNLDIKFVEFSEEIKAKTLSRIKEIKDAKTVSKGNQALNNFRDRPIKYGPIPNYNYYSESKDIDKLPVNSFKYNDELPFTTKELPFKEKIADLTEGDIMYDQITYDSILLYKALSIILTGSPFLDDKDIDIKNVIKLSLDRYPVIFKEIQTFESWNQGLIDFALENYIDQDLAVLEYTEEEIQSILAVKIQEELEEYKEDKYIEVIINYLFNYIL